jgi:hypothetical protein
MFNFGHNEFTLRSVSCICTNSCRMNFISVNSGGIYNPYLTSSQIQLLKCGSPHNKMIPCNVMGFPRNAVSVRDSISCRCSRIFFFYLGYETIGTAATPGLLCQPRVIMRMIVESKMECRLAGETEVLGENLPQRHFCPSQNPTRPPGFEPGPPRLEAGD